MKISKTFLNMAIFAVMIILIFQGYLFYNLNNEVKSLDDSLSSLDNKIEFQRKNIENEISDLRNESANAIKGLGGNINALMKESEESKKAIEELSEGLEELENVQIKASKDFSSIISDVIDSVVLIQAGKGSQTSIGSGVFVSPEYLVTNYHVVEENPDDLLIGTVGNKVFRAQLIGYEPEIDIAVLHVADGNFPFLEFEDINNVKIGESVIAVGSPLGLSFSVTQGIISSKSRTGPNGLNIYLQTDTPINFGNSGGPLINLNKKIVAINTWKIANVESLGFAIRSDIAKDVYEQIIEQA
ncbi:trypsin-like peptidase domain-containing protein [Candidatus Woesearchaeota archaeon]|nr:trypsin-like peptidase domain-containing protein [Candidatus Woesearchaeota archaeon]